MNSPLRPDPDTTALAEADRLLQRYFLAEVPTLWPAPPRDEVRPQPRAPRRAFTMQRSHLALAASFLVAIGCWWCCGLSQSSPPERPLSILGEQGERERAKRPGHGSAAASRRSFPVPAAGDSVK